MAKTADQDMALARVYASALLTVAEEQGKADAVLAELQEILTLADQVPAVAEFFASPLADSEARTKMIEKLFRGRVSDLLVDALQVMNRKSRLDVVRPMVQAFRLALEEQRGIIDVHVRSAMPLSEALEADLRTWTQQYTGKTPELIATVDPALLGGMVVQIGDEKFDMSVSTWLTNLEARLMERASVQIHTGTTHLEVAR